MHSVCCEMLFTEWMRFHSIELRAGRAAGDVHVDISLFNAEFARNPYTV